MSSVFVLRSNWTVRVWRERKKGGWRELKGGCKGKSGTRGGIGGVVGGDRVAKK